MNRLLDAAIVLSLLCLALCYFPACVGAPIDGGTVVAPIHLQIKVDGEVDVSSIRVAGMPFTYPLRAWGLGTVTIQYPNLPHVDFVGDGGWIIEPITPQDAPTIQALVAAGTIRGAVLKPAGTIAGMKEGPPR